MDQLRLLSVLSCLMMLGCPGKPQEPKTQPDVNAVDATTRPIARAPLPEPDSTVSIFFTADVQGHLEPCGCTKNPIGGVDRLSKYITEAKKRPKHSGAILLDAGDLLFEKKTITFDKDAQIDKAGLIAKFWTGLGLTAAMTGPRDLAAGPEVLQSPALASIPRLNASLPEKRRMLQQVGDLKIGIIGAASKDSGAPAAADPIAALKEDIAALTKDGAQQIIVLSYGNYSFAQSLANAGGMNFIVVASGDPEHIAKLDSEPGPSPTVTDSKVVLLTPFSQGQTVGEIEFRVSNGDLSFEDGGKPARVQEEAENTAKRIKEMQDKIEEAKKKKFPPTSLEKALIRLFADFDRQAKEAEAKIQGSHFVARVVSLSSEIGSNPDVEKTKEDFMIAQGVKFKEAAKSEVLPEPEPGKPGYVGAETCKDCHEEEFNFWKKTGHSWAMETLRGKPWPGLTDPKKDYKIRDGHPECVECHVAGLRKPGGTTLVSRIDELAGVQCENCHGPGSLHVDNLGKEKVPSIVLYPNESNCRSCHYPPHTNNFVFEERIKRIVGPGHMYEKKPK